MLPDLAVKSEKKDRDLAEPLDSCPMELRRLREAAGFTQAELAARAGVSRQLVSAVEAGRHLPRVDAALALAEALGTDVAALFGTGTGAVDVATGTPPPDGALVRVGRVGDRTVTAPVGAGGDGWDVADAYVEDGRVVTMGPVPSGPVLAGCEPGLAVLEGLLRQRGRGAVAVAVSSAAALDALRAERVHAAVVHGPAPSPPDDLAVVRFRLARWRVGLAGPPGAGGAWWRDALAGRTAVVQREEGAGVQRAFRRALTPGVGTVPGPRVRTHLDAARRAVTSGMTAVTIEPAALAMGAPFHPLETHRAELWVRDGYLADPAVAEALDGLTDRRFRRRLEAVGGYDLSGLGERVP